MKDKELEKLEKYQLLKDEIAKVWRMQKVLVVPVVIGALGAVSSKREVSGQEELRHFLMLELRTSTPSVTRASQHRKCSKSKKKRRSAITSSGC